VTPLHPEDRDSSSQGRQSFAQSTVSLIGQHKDEVLLLLLATNFALLAYLCATGAFSRESCRKKQYT